MPNNRFTWIELNKSDFYYRFAVKNLWLNFLLLCMLLVYIYNFHYFAFGVMFFSFLSGFFAFFAAFKAKFGKFECENSFSLLFIICAFGVGAVGGEFSRVITHLNILVGALMVVTILPFIFRYFRIGKE